MSVLQIFASMLSLLVTAGLDPAVHAEAPQTKAWPQIKQAAPPMDCRVKARQ
jgi:hypothetical protein